MLIWSVGTGGAREATAPAARGGARPEGAGRGRGARGGAQRGGAQRGHRRDPGDGGRAERLLRDLQRFLPFVSWCAHGRVGLHLLVNILS